MYHQVEVPGEQISGQSDYLILVANGKTDIVENPPLLKIEDLNLRARKERRQQVIRKEQCWHNFKGKLVGPGQCVSYSMLTDICVVVEPDTETEGAWKVVKEKN